MLRFVDHEFGSQMQGGMELSSATKVNDGHWIAHSENYLIDFKYKRLVCCQCVWGIRITS